MLSAEERALQTAISAAFIEADAESVSVYRPVRVYSNGGYKDTIPLTPSHSEICRMIPQSSDDTSAADEVRTPSGEKRNPRYVLMALPTADLQQGDVIEWNGLKWRLKQQHLTTSYEIKFDVVLYVGR